MTNLNAFTEAYIAAGLQLCDDEIGNVAICELLQETIEDCIADCNKFESDNHMELSEAYKSGYSLLQAGTDFWLTRNRHGAGFWDRGLGTIGDHLTAACDTYGECYFYIGDNKKVYIGA